MSSLLYAVAASAMLFLVRHHSRFSKRAALVLFLLPLPLIGRALVTGGVHAPIDLAYVAEPLASMSESAGIEQVVNPMASDVFAQFVPWADALRRVIALGQWPLWNPYEGGGGPLAAAVQSAPYHPITIVGLLLPVADGVTFTAAMAYLLAALTAFLLAREITSNELASLVAAAGFMMSTHFVSFVGVAHGLSIACLPLVLLGARRIVSAPGSRSALLLCWSLVLLLFAGHPESAMHIVSMAVLYFAFEVWRVRPFARWKSILASGLGAGIAALLLAAIFLLPMFDAIAQSRESIHRSTSTISQKTTSAAQSLHRLHVYAFPFLDGTPNIAQEPHPSAIAHTWLSSPYAGTLLFALALHALFAVRTRERWFFAVAIVWGVLSGVSPPGYTDLLHYIPGFSIAVNDRLVYFSALGMSILAAMALAQWMQQPSPKFAWTCLGIASIIALVALATSTTLPAEFIRAGAARAIVPLVLSALALLAWRSPRAVVLVLALLILQRVGETEALEATVPRRAFYPPFPGLELMRADEPFRIVAVGHLLPPLIATHYGLEDVRQFQAITFARTNDTDQLWSVAQPIWSNRVDDLRSPLLSAINVRFALAPAEHVAPSWWQERGRFGAYKVLENLRVLPRAFVPRAIHLGRIDEATLAEMRVAKDFADESWIKLGQERRDLRNGPGEITMTQKGSQIALHASMQDEGWVVISVPAWRGWHARASNGAVVPIRFANHGYMGIHLSAGEHDVRISYLPRSFVIGAWISAATLALVLAIQFLPRVRES